MSFTNGWRNINIESANVCKNSFKSELADSRASLSPQHLGEVFVAPDQKVVQEAQCWPNRSNMILYWSLLIFTSMSPFQLKGETYPCDAIGCKWMQYWPAISAPQRPCKKAASSSVAQSASATKNSLPEPKTNWSAPQDSHDAKLYWIRLACRLGRLTL